MRSIFVKAMIILLFASFVLPAGYELSSQQDPNSQVQKKERKRDGSGNKKQKMNKKNKKQKKNKKKQNKKIKKNKKNRIGRVK